MTDRAEPGPLVFTRPSCPLCGFFVDPVGQAWSCENCRAAWYPDGSFHSWQQPDALQCRSTTVNTWSGADFRCVLAAGHAGFHKHPRQALWRNTT